MTDKEPEVEIVERKPSSSHSSGASSSPEKFNYGKFLRALGKKPLVDGRLFRFLILFFIFVGLFDLSLLNAYAASAAVYGWKFIDQIVFEFRHRIPRKLYLMFTLKKAFYILLLALIARFVLGILIGWLVMPILLLLSLRYGKVDR